MQPNPELVTAAMEAQSLEVAMDEEWFRADGNIFAITAKWYEAARQQRKDRMEVKRVRDAVTACENYDQAVGLLLHHTDFSEETEQDEEE